MTRWTPWLIWPLLGVLALVFVLFGSGLDFDYVIPRRLLRLG